MDILVQLQNEKCTCDLVIFKIMCVLVKHTILSHTLRLARDFPINTQTPLHGQLSQPRQASTEQQHVQSDSCKHTTS